MKLRLATDKQAKVFIEDAERWVDWHFDDCSHDAIAELLANQNGFTLFDFMDGKEMIE